MKNAIALVLAVLVSSCAKPVLAQISPAGDAAYSGYMANESGLAFNKTYPIDITIYDGSRISAEVIYTSATFSAVTFSTVNYSLNGSVISAPSHGLTLALPVLYNVASGPAIVGLTTQTTYYVIPVNTSSIEIASTSALAQAGSFLTLQSTTTSSNSYTLTPLGITGTPSFKWEASNDNIIWTTTLTTGTVTISSYSNPAAVSLFDFGSFNFRYFRLNVTAPTAGGLSIKAPIYIKQDGIGRF